MRSHVCSHSSSGLFWWCPFTDQLFKPSALSVLYTLIPPSGSLTTSPLLCKQIPPSVCSIAFSSTESLDFWFLRSWTLPWCFSSPVEKVASALPSPQWWRQVVLPVSWWLSLGRCVQPHLMARWHHHPSGSCHITSSWLGIFCLLPLQESPGTQIFIPGAANIQFTFLAEMFGASSLYKSPSDHSVLFPEHTFPWHVLLSRKIEGSDSEIEMPWFGWADEIRTLSCTPQNRMSDLSAEENMKKTLHSPNICLCQKEKGNKKATNSHCLGGGKLPCAWSCLLLTGKEQQMYYFAVYSPNFIFQPAYVFCRLQDFYGQGCHREVSNDWADDSNEVQGDGCSVRGPQWTPYEELLYN